MRRILAALLCLIVVGLARADEKPAAPKTQPPNFLYLVDVGKDNIVINVQEYIPTTEEVTVNVVKNGVMVAEKRQVTVYKVVVKQVAQSTRDMKFLDAAGKELKREDAVKMLKPGMVVLTTTDPNGVDPAYLKLLAKDTLILVTNQAKAPPGTVVPAPTPAPPPPPKPAPPGEKSGE